MAPDTYRLFGLLLILGAVVDYFYFGGGWHLHLFYTGLLCFLCGSIMAYLASIKSAADAVEAGLREAREHVVSIRSLTDAMNIRSQQSLEHLLQARSLLDAIRTHLRG